jgi:hypothetical protein
MIELIKDPSVAAIIGGLGGALITSLVSLLLWKASQNKKRIDCMINETTELVSISDRIKEKLEIQYEGQKVNSAFLFNVVLTHTGNDAIKNQPVIFKFPPPTKIINYKFETVPSVDFGEVREKLNADNELKLEIELLNKKNKISFDIYTIENPSDVIEIGLKNENVDARMYSKKTLDKLVTSMSDDAIMNLFAITGALPFVGWFFKPLFNYALMRKLNKIEKQEKVLQ